MADGSIPSPAVDIKTQVRLQLRGRTILPEPGSARMLRTPPTPFVLPYTYLRARCLPALLLLQKGGGRDPWLILSYHSFSLHAVDHEALFTPEDLLSGELIWGHSCSLHFHCTPTHSSIRCELTAHSQSPWWDRLGDPQADAAWLSHLLMPRRCPGAFRVQSPHLQLWVRLAP